MNKVRLLRLLPLGRSVVGLCALTLTGCLVPLPIEEDVPEENSPPYFPPDGVEPSYSQIIDYNPDSDGDTVLFEVSGYDDDNANDRLFWRWYIDYTSLNRAVETVGVGAGLTPELRGTPITLEVNPCQLSRRSLHRIDLIVADRAFLSVGDEPEGTPSPNQTLPEDAGSFRITWFLTLDQDNCR